MVLKLFFDISTSFRFSENQCECPVHSWSLSLNRTTILSSPSNYVRESKCLDKLDRLGLGLKLFKIQNLTWASIVSIFPAWNSTFQITLLRSRLDSAIISSFANCIQIGTFLGQPRALLWRNSMSFLFDLLKPFNN